MAELEDSPLKQRIGAATTAAMKARDKARVATLRLLNAEIKRVEVDERRDPVRRRRHRRAQPHAEAAPGFAVPVRVCRP
jgi:hypothetical protein